MTEKQSHLIDQKITDIRIKVQQEVGKELIDRMLYDLQITLFKLVD